MSEMPERMNGGAVSEERSPETDAMLRARERERDVDRQYLPAVPAKAGQQRTTSETLPNCSSAPRERPSEPHARRGSGVESECEKAKR